eukprot:11244945-Alexandrium_andersonii.AAC.1
MAGRAARVRAGGRASISNMRHALSRQCVSPSTCRPLVRLSLGALGHCRQDPLSEAASFTE